MFFFLLLSEKSKIFLSYTCLFIPFHADHHPRTTAWPLLVSKGWKLERDGSCLQRSWTKLCCPPFSHETMTYPSGFWPGGICNSKFPKQTSVFRWRRIPVFTGNLIFPTTFFFNNSQSKDLGINYWLWNRSMWEWPFCSYCYLQLWHANRITIQITWNIKIKTSLMHLWLRSHTWDVSIHLHSAGSHISWTDISSAKKMCSLSSVDDA